MKIKILLVMLGLLLVYGISAAEPRDLAEIRTAIDKSALPGESKTTLFKRASEAVSAGIPASDVSVIISRGVLKSKDGKALEETLGAAITAKEKGLPVRPVLDRIEQGLAKGVPPERIVAATKQLVVKLSTADAIVSNLGKSGLKAGEQKEKGLAVHSVARALEKSIPEDVINNLGQKSITKGASLSRLSATIDTMAFFVEMGMNLDQASGLMMKAMDKGYSEGEMFMMQKDMSDMMRGKSNMNDVMKNMDTMMNRGTMGSGAMGGKGMGGGSTSPGAHGSGSSGPGNPGMGGSGMGGSGMGGGHRHK
ncbi:MAG: hypothetical protein C0402_12430 [Thermodesulfovibrio sp.]|nr:hypothetical protein [Thermodesulfovibrio sp.]